MGNLEILVEYIFASSLLSVEKKFLWIRVLPSLSVEQLHQITAIFEAEQGTDYSKLPENVYAKVKETQMKLLNIVAEAKETLRIKRETAQNGSDAEKLKELDNVLASL